MIRTAETDQIPGAGETCPEALVRMAWPHHRADYRPPQDVAGEPFAHVEVNHGRWIVRCPFCPGAQLASVADRRFFCLDCLHVGTKAEGRWIHVSWPSARADIERVLLTRPAASTRNWSWGERVQDLVAENRERGLA